MCCHFGGIFPLFIAICLGLNILLSVSVSGRFSEGKPPGMRKFRHNLLVQGGLRAYPLTISCSYFEWS